MNFVKHRFGEIVFVTSFAVSVFWMKAVLYATPPIPSLYPTNAVYSPGKIERPMDLPMPSNSVTLETDEDPAPDRPNEGRVGEDLTQELNAIRDQIVGRFRAQCARNSFSPMDFKYGDTWLKVALSDPIAREQLKLYLYGLFQTHPELSDRILGEAMGAIARTHAGFYQSILEEATRKGRWDVARAAIAVAFVAGLDDESFLLAAEPIATSSQAGQYSVVSAIRRRYQGGGPMPDAVNSFCRHLLEQSSTDLGALQLASFAVGPFASREEWAEYIDRVSDIAYTTDDIGRTYMAAVQIQMSSYVPGELTRVEMLRDRGESAIAGISTMVASPWPILQYRGAIAFERFHQELMQISGGN